MRLRQRPLPWLLVSSAWLSQTAGRLCPNTSQDLHVNSASEAVSPSRLTFIGLIAIVATTSAIFSTCCGLNWSTEWSSKHSLWPCSQRRSLSQIQKCSAFWGLWNGWRASVRYAYSLPSMPESASLALALLDLHPSLTTYSCVSAWQFSRQGSLLSHLLSQGCLLCCAKLTIHWSEVITLSQPVLVCVTSWVFRS